MPYVVNPDGAIVCVTVEESKELLKSQPQVKDEKGNVIRSGFRIATEQEVKDDQKAAKEQNRKRDKRGG